MGGVVVAEPAPSWALNGNCPFGHLVNQIFIRPKLAVDLLGEGWLLWRVLSSSLADGGEILPVDGVIDVSSQVEFDGLAEGGHFVVVEVGLGIWVYVSGTVKLFEGGVEIVDIGLVMFFVMDFEQFAADHWLQSRVAVLEVGEAHFARLCWKGSENCPRYHCAKHPN